MNALMEEEARGEGTSLKSLWLALVGGTAQLESGRGWAVQETQLP